MTKILKPGDFMIKNGYRGISPRGLHYEITAWDGPGNDHFLAHVQDKHRVLPDSLADRLSLSFRNNEWEYNIDGTFNTYGFGDTFAKLCSYWYDLI